MKVMKERSKTKTKQNRQSVKKLNHQTTNNKNNKIQTHP